MNILEIGIVLAVVAIILLILPSLQKKTSKGADEVAKDSKKGADVKEAKKSKRELKKSSALLGKSKEVQTPEDAKATKAAKPKKGFKAKIELKNAAVRQAHEPKKKGSTKGLTAVSATDPDLDDALLGDSVQSLMPEITPEEPMPEIKPEGTATENAYSAPAISTEETMVSEDTHEEKKSAALGIKRRRSRKAITSIEPAETEAPPVIEMGDEPVIHSNRVRKKLNTDIPDETKTEITQGISFEGSDTSVGTSDIDELFENSSLSDEDFKKMMFGEIAPTKLSTGVPNTANGESLADEFWGGEAVSDAQADEVHESTSDVGKESQVAEPEITEPTEPEVTATESEPEEQTAEPTEPEVAASEPIESEVAASASEPEEQAADPTDTFVPGSVDMSAPRGLKFRDRDSVNKASEVLPEVYEPHTSGEEVHVTVSQPDTKAPNACEYGLEIYNGAVYSGDKLIPWNTRYEVLVREGEELTVDTGVGIQVPDGYHIRLVPNKYLQDKFGLKLVSEPELTALDAAYFIKFKVAGLSMTSYIAKNQSLVYVQVYKINQE